MGYGRATGGAAVPVTFRCDECYQVVVIHQEVGKDYIFEETVHEATQQIETSCGWVVDGAQSWCNFCVDPDRVNKWRRRVRNDKTRGGRRVLEESQDGGNNWLLIRLLS